MEDGTKCVSDDPHRLLDLKSNNNDAASYESCPVVLPVGYQLSQWRVSDGSVVHTGETIAVITAININTGDGNGSDNIDVVSVGMTLAEEKHPQNHRRPSRRKRPLAVQSQSNDFCDKSPSEGFTPTTYISAINIRSSTARDGMIASNVNKTASTNVNNNKLRNPDTTTITAKADGICRKIDIKAVADTSDIILGWIDPCLHPTIISGLCAVCGAKVRNNLPSTASLPAGTTDNNINKTMTLMTVSGMTVTVSESESRRMAIEDTKRLQGIGKLSLVLDLDHTLLHATADPRAEMQCRHRNDIRRLVLQCMPVDSTNSAIHQQLQYHPGWLQHFVKLRPHVKSFFEQAMENYEIGVYTAGTRDYAEQVTIILSRHLVGAKRDQIELEQLRQQFVHAEQTYHRQQSMRSKNNDPINDDEGLTLENIVADTSTSSDIKKEMPGIKRKRVQFEEPAVTTQTDELTLEVIEKLRTELYDAERLEGLAHNLRRRLFGSRVMSRTESGESGRNVKSLKRIFPCGGSMAAVIDDREDVWANADEMNSTRLGEPPENLLLVRPYHWNLFHGYADVNNASGMDYSATDTSSDIEIDEQLVWTTAILKSLHQRYYKYGSTERRTVPMILEEMRSEVLKGCVIVLSGLIPLSQQPNTNPNHPRSCFIRYAESLGAVVFPYVSASVTHVVAASDGTDKIISARKIKGCCIVKPSWLSECYWSMTRRDESDHVLGNAIKLAPYDTNLIPKYRDYRPGNDMVKDSVISTHYDIEDDNDNNFSAELENEFLNDDDDEDL